MIRTGSTWYRLSELRSCHVERLCCRQRGFKLAARQLDIIDADSRYGFISGRHETRQDQIGRRFSSDRQRLISLSQAARRPGNRHQSQLTVEFRNAEIDLSFATAADFDNSAEQGHGLRWHDRQAFSAKLVTAGSNFSWQSEVRIEQAAIIVIQRQTHSLFAIIPVGRVRARELGQTQDTLIHCRQGHESLLAWSPFDRHSNRLIAAWPDQLRGFDFNIERTVFHAHRHVADAHGAAWFRLNYRVSRRVDIDHHIGALAPLIGHRQSHRRARCLNLTRFDRQDAIRRDDDLSFAVIRRNNRQSSGSACDDLLFIDGDLYPVRCFDPITGDVTTPSDPESPARTVAIF